MTLNMRFPSCTNYCADILILSVAHPETAAEVNNASYQRDPLSKGLITQNQYEIAMSFVPRPTSTELF